MRENKSYRLNSIRHYLSQVMPINDKNWELIAPLWSSIEFNQGELILRPNEVCHQMFFLVEGMARCYFLDESGREFNWSFHFNDSEAKSNNVFMLDYASFISESKSRIYIECLSDMVVFAITKKDLYQLYNKSHFWSEMGRLISEQVYVLVHNRSLNQLALDAKERYVQFVKNYPYLVERLSQNQIASFLGITPQSLSRLKNSE